MLGGPGGLVLTYFYTNKKVEIFKKMFFVDGVKIQWPETPLELVSGPGGLVSTNFWPNEEVEFSKNVFLLKM